MDEPTRIRAAALFSALRHPVRLHIVELLTHREMTVGELADTLGIPQPNASQHLASLLRPGVLSVTPKGTSRVYRIRGPRIRGILELIEEFCEIQGLKGEPKSE